MAEAPGEAAETPPPKEEVAPPELTPEKAAAAPRKKRHREDFDFGRLLGEGSYGMVRLATEKATGVQYAVKILKKSHIIKYKKVKYVQTEKTTMNALDHPNIIHLRYTFQDKANLYFVLEPALNGELVEKIEELGTFSLDAARFYTAEIVLALEHCHSRGVIHRDLKPENLLFGDGMHLKLCDFGTSKKIGTEKRARANSFVGTAEYVSPELLNDKVAFKSSDLWALGCIVFQLLAGRPPFRHAVEYQLFQKISKRDFTFPEGFPEDAEDLVNQLLVLDPDQRLGADVAGGFDPLKAHRFFEGFDWDTLPSQTPPPLVAPVKDEVVEEKKEEVEDYKKDPERLRKITEQNKTSPWREFLIDNELIMCAGLVHKRKGIRSRKRQMILTDFPRLIYIDADKMELKGQISWSADLKPELKNNRIFFIHTPGRTYYLEDASNDAQRWVMAIDAELLRYKQRKALAEGVPMQ